MLAEAGITGPHSIIEGEKGFCKVFAVDYDLNRLTDGLGTKWHMLDNGIKGYSCCHLIHFAFDALDVLRDRRKFTAAEVKEVRIATNSQQILSHIGSIIEPNDILGAQFSMPFSIAMRLHHGGRRLRGGNGFWDYVDVDLKDPALLDTARKVKVVVGQDPTRWARVDEGGEVTVELMDGTSLSVEYPHAWGLPENPMSLAEVEDKFRYVTGPVISDGRQAALISAMRNVEFYKVGQGDFRPYRDGAGAECAGSRTIDVTIGWGAYVAPQPKTKFLPDCEYVGFSKSSEVRLSHAIFEVFAPEAGPPEIFRKFPPFYKPWADIEPGAHEWRVRAIARRARTDAGFRSGHRKL